MPSLKDIRTRISSVKNTRQITRAMKMVAAAKLRRSQDAILSARPYAYRIYSILIGLSKKEGMSHPFLENRSEKRVRLIVIAGDRGLCGSFNANIFKETTRFLKSKDREGISVELECIGKKANEFFKKKHEIIAYHEGVLNKPDYRRIATIAQSSIDEYLDGTLDAIYVVYNEFKSAIQQKVIVEKLVPVTTEVPDGVTALLAKKEEPTGGETVFEPSAQVVLNEIVPRHFKTQLFRAVLESVASEHGARMSAMENASKNASEMIDRLTLSYNKARQASITKELMEIVSGVEAMR